MTGQLGNVMSTYANMIAIQWRLGFKYFLPRYMNHHTNQAGHHYTVNSKHGNYKSITEYQPT